MQRKVMMLGAGSAVGVIAIAFATSIDRIYALPAVLTIAFVCARWGAGRQRRPMPESWFEPRKH